jgi:hypothetical protein
MPLNEDKKKSATPAIAAAAAGGVVGGAGLVDLRPKKDLYNAKRLGNTWSSVRKHIKPGDVLVGSQKSIETMWTEMPLYYQRAMTDLKLMDKKKPSKWYPEEDYKLKSKSKMGRLVRMLPKPIGDRVRAGYASLAAVGPTTIASKMNDPVWSHGEMFIGKNKSVSVGNNYALRGDEVMPKNVSELKGGDNYIGHNPHFAVLRPKEGSNVLKEMSDKIGFGKAQSQVERDITKRKYGMKGAIAATLKETFLPKLNRSERLLSSKEIARNLSCKKGVCSTAGAVYSRTTVGGKANALDVLPSDYLRSKQYDLVGVVGKREAPSISTHLIQGAPKILGRIGAGALAAGGAYAVTKSILNRKQMTKQSSLYMNEVVCIPMQ